MNSLIAKSLKLHDQTFALVSRLQSPFLLLVRLYWGWQLGQSGWGKLHHLENVAEFFGTLNLPHPAQMALFISSVEFFGGILFAIGLFSRMTALVLTINMLMAYITADREAFSSFISNPDKFAAAAPYVFLISSLIILILGPGKFCVDYLLRRFAHLPNTVAKDPYES
jgi:putative oxidoreductase